MEQFQLPEPLFFQGNLAENWRRWKQRFEVYMVASGKNAKSDEVKAATFLHLAGPDASKSSIHFLLIMLVMTRSWAS